jgi:hypothetical protein
VIFDPGYWDDVATSLDAELLDALLLRFVEDLIAEDSITVQDVKV